MFHISSQERKIIVPIFLHSAFPHPCIKFAFLHAHVPKMPGTRERGNAKTWNERPSLSTTIPQA